MKTLAPATRRSPDSLRRADRLVAPREGWMVPSVDQIMAEERAAAFAKRSIKTSAKLAGLKLAISMMDLTTLEGKDTPGNIAFLFRKAMQPLDPRYQVPSCAAVCVYSNLVRVAKKFLGNSRVKVASVATAFPAATCVAINSDRMTFTYEPFRAPRRQNIPTLNGHREAAASHRAPIVKGFCEMFRLALRERESLLDLIRGFRDPPGRFVARSSNTYGLLLQASLSPDALRDGAGRGLLFERLRRTPLCREDRPGHWPILNAETQALERMDVPRVQSTDSDATLCWPSPASQAAARIARMSERDIETRVRQLRQELARLESLPDSAPLSGGKDPETYQEACHG